MGQTEQQVSALFSLRTKLTAMLLFASLMAALAVGGTAYWMLMKDFNATVREHAFVNFQEDMQAYIGEYGSWDSARHQEPFPEFVRRHRGTHGLPLPEQADDEDNPPFPVPPEEMKDAPAESEMRPAIPHRQAIFRFMLVDPQGKVLLAVRNYAEGQMVSEDILREARPISVNGKVEVLAVPIGAPQLSEQDKAYLSIMRKALLGGIVAASMLAIVLGFVLGNRVGVSVRELTAAIKSMSAEGELLQQVPVRTRDEIGLLARAFNRMSSELALAHTELKATTEQMQLQADQLKELSIRDPLTQMFNRRYFDEQAEMLYQQAMRHSRPFSVMVGDLDHFKAINDNFSHAIGDEVLRRVADLMRQNTRRSDVVARYGGEEFVVAFVESTAQQAAVRCEELRRSIEQHPWHEVHPELRVSMSMGISDDMAQGNVEKMLAAADVGLYQAKDAGRNRVVIA